MTNIIKIKRTSTPSSTPASLEHGELAINYSDGKIFYKNSSNQITQFSSGQKITSSTTNQRTNQRTNHTINQNRYGLGTCDLQERKLLFYGPFVGDRFLIASSQAWDDR